MSWQARGCKPRVPDELRLTPRDNFTVLCAALAFRIGGALTRPRLTLILHRGVFRHRLHTQ